MNITPESKAIEKQMNRNQLIFHFAKKMKETKVVHCKKEKYDVYIGRGSIWGNPFHIGKDGSRNEVIAKYKKYILADKSLMKELPNLQGKTLGCWCKPRACHGDVLVEIIKDMGVTK